jgi:hypothetical protein
MTDRVTKLGGKGIIAFEVDGVLGRLTKKQSANVDLAKSLSQFIRAGAVIGAAIKTRMRDKRTYADGTMWEPGDGGKFRVSRKYAKLAGFEGRARQRARILTRRDGGRAKWRRRTDVGFTSTAQMYEAATHSKGAFDVTGGMWKGLTARTWGSKGVRILFDGTSQGRGKLRTFDSNLRGQPIFTKASESVRNWRKAGLVYLAKNKNILEINEREVLGIASAVGITSLRAVADALGGKGRVPIVNIQFEGDKALGRKLADLLAR